jgi:hypothetical protein
MQKKQIFRLVVGVVCGTMAAPLVARAQVEAPALNFNMTASSVVPLSAGEVAQHVRLTNVRIDDSVAYSQRSYPIERLLAQKTSAASQWLAGLRTRPIKGIQLDAASVVSVNAGDEALAHAQIAERLATPGLSVTDRAFTYLTAVKAFANVHYPARLPAAEDYAKRLDALGDSAATSRFVAHRTIANVHYMLGHSADLIRHGTQAITLVPKMPFYERQEMYIFGCDLYTEMATALAPLPEGKARMAALNAILRAGTAVPAKNVALDTSFIGLGKALERSTTAMIASVAVLGNKAVPFVANYWVNRPSRDSATLYVDDGKIRLVEISAYRCKGCVIAMPGLQRLQERFPTVEIVTFVYTYGGWANRLVEPGEEADSVAKHFTTRMKLTYPIGIWKAAKGMNEDGGMTPIEPGGPNMRNYATVVAPTTYAIDGKGIIRGIFFGCSREMEEKMAHMLEFLTHEAAATTSASAVQPAATTL